MKHTKLKISSAALFVLGAVVLGGWLLARQTEAAGQSKGDTEEKQPASDKTDNPPKSLDKAKLHGEWIVMDKHGDTMVIFGPQNAVHSICGKVPPNQVFNGGTYSVDWSKTPYHLDVKWKEDPARQLIMEFADGGKLRICGDGDKGRPKTFDDENTLLLVKKERPSPGSKEAQKAAEEEFETADRYFGTRRFRDAYHCFELIRNRYPESDLANKAQQRLDGLIQEHRLRYQDGSEEWEPEETPAELQEKIQAARDDIEALQERLKTLERQSEAVKSKEKKNGE